MAKQTGRIEPELYAIDVPEDKWAQLADTGLEYAPIANQDDYAVRDTAHPEVEIRRTGDEWRKLGAALGRGAPAEETAREESLQDIHADDDAYRLIDGTGLEYAKLDDLDAYAVRDVEHPGEIRRPGNDWRKFGAVI
ncbi:hypothetical protein AB0I81_40330 [Nonomuraea sp. NPDC050404]|uniref:hypothetical protein n=1 Tax=Nonomuraea sp. NPDC050404 TaxID=3155783 RepID=UPI0033D984F4